MNGQGQMGFYPNISFISSEWSRERTVRSCQQISSCIVLPHLFPRCRCESIWLLIRRRNFFKKKLSLISNDGYGFDYYDSLYRMANLLRKMFRQWHTRREDRAYQLCFYKDQHRWLYCFGWSRGIYVDKPFNKDRLDLPLCENSYQLPRLKAMYQHLRALISINGWVQLSALHDVWLYRHG